MKAVHFRIQELVDRDTYGTYDEKAWDFLHPDAVAAIDGVRAFFGLPVTVNNWLWDGQFQYRGYRPPHCGIGAPQSYHRRGMAFDFDVKGMHASEVRNAIRENKNDGRLKNITRMEAGVNWVHIDLGTIPQGKERIYLFKV